MNIILTNIKNIEKESFNLTRVTDDLLVAINTGAKVYDFDAPETLKARFASVGDISDYVAEEESRMIKAKINKTAYTPDEPITLIEIEGSVFAVDSSKIVIERLKKIGKDLSNIGLKTAGDVVSKAKKLINKLGK